jgi:hypothetical protein
MPTQWQRLAPLLTIRPMGDESRGESARPTNVSAANPYAAPEHFADLPRPLGPPTLSFRQAIAWVASIAGAGAILGAIGGLLLGLAAPDYYHAVFRDPQLSPVQLGLGLGLTQGLGTGLAIGCVVVLAVALSRRRRND